MRRSQCRRVHGHTVRSLFFHLYDEHVAGCCSRHLFAYESLGRGIAQFSFVSFFFEFLEQHVLFVAGVERVGLLFSVYSEFENHARYRGAECFIFGLSPNEGAPVFSFRVKRTRLGVVRFNALRLLGARGRTLAAR